MARRLSSRPAEPAQSAAPVSPLRRWSRWAALLGLLGGALLAFVAAREFGPDRGDPGDTRNPQAYSAFAEGSALYMSRQYRDALIALERAVSLDPSYGLAWAWLAKTYGRLSQPMWAGGAASSARAAEAAERAARLAPGLAESHIALALAARSKSNLKDWRAAARHAMDLDARAAEAMALLADSYSAYPYACGRDEDPALAESYYGRALDLKPNLVTAASNRAHNLRRMGRLAECEALMNRVIRAFPDETPLIAERGACRLLAGDVAGATQDIAPLRNNPKIAPAGALVYLGLLELKTGSPDDGIRDLESVIRLDHSARAELVVAEAYGLAGDLGRASTHLQRAFDLDRTCVGTVDTGATFAAIRRTEAVEGLLARYRGTRVR
ncbi:MAG: tetratricopeptide repeat protein [Vicinamibacteria bacterium]